MSVFSFFNANIVRMSMSIALIKKVTIKVPNANFSAEKTCSVWHPYLVFTILKKYFETIKRHEASKTFKITLHEY